jgi:iron(III) transport system ATP-binding protein
MRAVSLKSVTKRFDNVVAVDDVSFEVAPGELLTLLGPSGCGKTTTMRLIAGLERNDGGEITVGDRVVSSAERRVFLAPEKRDIGMVFQSYAIWPHMTVFQNVAYPLKVRRVRRQEIEQRVSEVLELVGLGGLEHRLAPHLSGGQQQRVALARALVFRPSLLLLDEPLSNLDAKLRASMRIELKRLQEQTGITTVYVTHDQAESMALSDRIIVMNQGRIEQVGDPKSLYEHPRSQFVAEFIGTINIIPAQVAELKPAEGLCVLNAPVAQPFTCARPAEQLLEIGQSVGVLIRPERIRLRPLTGPAFSERESALNRWRGQVEMGIYFGDRREYLVHVGDLQLQAVTPVDVDLDRGQEVEVEIAAHDAVLLPGPAWSSHTHQSSQPAQRSTVPSALGA